MQAARIAAAVPALVVGPGDAGRVYVILASFSGKWPGIPLAALGDGSDTRVLQNNFSRTESRVPILGSIPVIGELYRTHGVITTLFSKAPSKARCRPGSRALPPEM